MAKQLKSIQKSILHDLVKYGEWKAGLWVWGTMVRTENVLNFLASRGLAEKVGTYGGYTHFKPTPEAARHI